MKNTTMWLDIGVISIIAGFLALANPFGASLALTTFIGWRDANFCSMAGPRV